MNEEKELLIHKPIKKHNKKSNISIIILIISIVFILIGCIFLFSNNGKSTAFKNITNELDKDDNISLNNKKLLINNKQVLEEDVKDLEIYEIFSIEDYYLVFVRDNDTLYPNINIYKNDGSLYKTISLLDTENMIIDPRRVKETNPSEEVLYIYGTRVPNDTITSDAHGNIYVCDNAQLSLLGISSEYIVTNKYQLKYDKENGFKVEPSNEESETISEYRLKRCN